MCDELFGDIDNLTDTSQKELNDFFSSKDSVWIALSNDYYGSLISDSDDPELVVKRNFPNFEVSRMVTPLRMPKNVAESVRSTYKNIIGEFTQLSLNQRLCKDSKLPSNLVDGCKMEWVGIGTKFKTLFEVLKEALSKIPKGSKAVIVIDDTITKPVTQAIRSTIKCQHCRNIINVITMDVALSLLGKKVLYHCIDYSSPEELIKAFISGMGEWEIIVVSFELMRGFEHHIIIDTTLTTSMSSRTSSKLLKMFTNQFLDMMMVSEQLLKEGQHECQNMMNRELRPQVIPNVLPLMGEFFFNKF